MDRCHDTEENAKLDEGPGTSTKNRQCVSLGLRYAEMLERSFAKFVDDFGSLAESFSMAAFRPVHAEDFRKRTLGICLQSSACRAAVP